MAKKKPYDPNADLKFLPEPAGGGSYSTDIAVAAASSRSTGETPCQSEEVRWPKPGDRMKFMNRNGYEGERAEAAKLFAPDQVLIVKRCSVGSWSHSLWFEGYERRGWNGVMFEFIDGLERYPLPQSTTEEHS
jgi:hypothetical protein